MMESVLLLATMAQRFQPCAVPGHPVETLPSITLRPKRGVWMELRQRRDIQRLEGGLHSVPSAGMPVRAGFPAITSDGSPAAGA
jgi:hypothetical protein